MMPSIPYNGSNLLLPNSVANNTMKLIGDEFKVPDPPRKPAICLIQRQLVYYSDFEFCLKEWKHEASGLEKFSTLLQANLEVDWLDSLKSTLREVPCKLSLKKDLWNSLIEYIELTLYSPKDEETRVSELRIYLSFYGFENSDASYFSVLIKKLLEASKLAFDTFLGIEKLKRDKLLDKKEDIYKKIIKKCKKSKIEVEAKKSDITKYTILQRELTPLFIANEKEKKEEEKNVCEKMGDFVSYEDRIQDLSHLRPPPTLAEKPRKNVGHSHAKSLLEMSKLDARNPNLFCKRVLKAIFSFIDYNVIKQNEPCPCSVIGDFAVLILQVHASEIKDIHQKIGVEMPYDNLNLRIMKIYKDFYKILMRVILIYGIQEFSTIVFEDYQDAVKSHFGSYWTEDLTRPARSFYNWARELSLKYNNEGKEHFFKLLSNKMHAYWNKEIVNKSSSFKRTKIEGYSLFN